jgi:hypothetical protein
LRKKAWLATYEVRLEVGTGVDEVGELGITDLTGLAPFSKAARFRRSGRSQRSGAMSSFGDCAKQENKIKKMN